MATPEAKFLKTLMLKSGRPSWTPHADESGCGVEKRRKEPGKTDSVFGRFCRFLEECFPKASFSFWSKILNTYFHGPKPTKNRIFEEPGQ